DAYLSLSRDRLPPPAAYEHVWASKAAVTRILQARHAARATLRKSPEVKAAGEELVLVRGQLTYRLNHPGKDHAAHDREVRRLTRRIEELERRIGKALPEMPRRKEMDKLGPTDLAVSLPRHTAFIELIRYTHYEKTKPKGLHYVIFVLPSKGKIQ